MRTRPCRRTPRQPAPKLPAAFAVALALCLVVPAAAADDTRAAADGAKRDASEREAKLVTCELPPQLRRTFNAVVPVPGRVEPLPREVCAQRGGRVVDPPPEGREKLEPLAAK